MKLIAFDEDIKNYISTFNLKLENKYNAKT